MVLSFGIHCQWNSETLHQKYPSKSNWKFTYWTKSVSSFKLFLIVHLFGVGGFYTSYLKKVDCRTPIYRWKAITCISWNHSNSTKFIWNYTRIGGALSSISLPIERAPPLSNSLHTIYHVILFVSVYCIFFHINVLIFCNSVLFPCSVVTC